MKASRKGNGDLPRTAEITLNLVARTAFDLHRLNPNEATLDGQTLEHRGEEAIELLSIWHRLLQIEETTGAAAKKAEEVLSRWQAEREEKRGRHEELEREARQRADWAKIPKTQQISLGRAASKIFPGKPERIKWLERILTILTEKESALPEALKGICRKALKYKSVPEGLIPHLKASRELALKTYKSRIAKQSGRKGGIKRAQKYSRNKTAGANDSSKIASEEEN